MATQPMKLEGLVGIERATSHTPSQPTASESEHVQECLDDSSKRLQAIEVLLHIRGGERGSLPSFRGSPK